MRFELPLADRVQVLASTILNVSLMKGTFLRMSCWPYRMEIVLVAHFPLVNDAFILHERGYRIAQANPFLASGLCVSDFAEGTTLHYLPSLFEGDIQQTRKL
jgi:hypothetical protein